jgi:hypothetical protein
MKATVILIVMGVLTSLIWLSGGLMPLCGEKLQGFSSSPDGKWEAILIQRDCGATTGMATHIVLHATNTGLNVKNLIPIAILQTDIMPHIKWKDKTRLHVSWNQPTAFFKNETRADGIDIEYSPAVPSPLH